MRRRTALALAQPPAPLAAQQVLHEPRPPAGSACLPLVNATAEPLAIRPSMTVDATLGIEGAARVSAHTVQEAVAGRPVEVALSASGRVGLRLEPGSFNTLLVVVDAASLRAWPIADQTQLNRTRARLTFHNAMTECPEAGLNLHPQGQAVFADVGAGTPRRRRVNPVTANIRAVCGEARGAPFALAGLVAGGQYSIWLMAPRGQMPGFVPRDQTTPWRR